MVGQSNFDISAADVVRDCYVLHKKLSNKQTLSLAESDHLDRVKSCLESLLFFQAKLHSLYFRQWIVDDHNPGYLISNIPGVYCRVPVHILPLFPDVVEFRRFAELAQEVRTSNKSIVCLSGSNAFGRAIQQINDVDLCEYIPVEGDDFSHCDNFTNTTEVFKIKAKIGNTPWTTNKRSASDVLKELVDLEDETACRGMSEYLCISGERNATELANVLLFCNNKFEGKATQYSFAAQQAPIDLVDIPPNELTNPREMGRYIEFLAGQMSLYIKKGDLIKALKRCLSLSRILFAKEITNGIIELISEDTFFLSKEIEKYKALRGKTIDLKSAIDKRIFDRVLKEFEIIIEVKEKEYRLRSDNSHPSAGTEFHAKVEAISSALLKLLGIKDKLITG